MFAMEELPPRSDRYRRGGSDITERKAHLPERPAGLAAQSARYRREKTEGHRQIGSRCHGREISFRDSESFEIYSG